MSSGVNDAEQCNGVVLNIDDPVDNVRLQGLRADPRIEFIDTVRQQRAALQRLRPPRLPT